MTFATSLQFAQRSGLGLRVVDENVGTGDSAEKSFDLDNDNVISSSYVLNHSASGDNDFTALVETTHYTLDKESGKIYLTAGGLTEVGTDIIYATYWYIESFSDSVISDYLDGADDEIELITGKRYGSPTSKTEYMNGNPRSKYPTTDRPFTYDFNPKDYVMLIKYPVRAVNFAYFLNDPINISKFFNYDDGTAVYTDKSDEVNSSSESPFIAFDDSPVADDFIYIGCSDRFLGLDINLSVAGTGSPAIDWEYYNGSSWTDITETESDTGSSTFEASGKFVWSYPYGWEKNAVNSNTLYWLRGKLTTGYTIDPQIATISIIDSINKIIEPRGYKFTETGKLIFYDDAVLNGDLNVRVDYSYGESSVPSYITELSILLASVKSYINLSGGSYDDYTSFTLNSKSATIGEVYVNIREVIFQFKKRIDEIVNMIGKRANVVAV